MVGRKYLTATVGEIRTYFFPLVVRYSDANPSVRYAAALLLYLFFLLLSKYQMANICRVTGKKSINIPSSVLFFSTIHLSDMLSTTFTIFLIASYKRISLMFVVYIFFIDTSSKKKKYVCIILYNYRIYIDIAIAEYQHNKLKYN